MSPELASPELISPELASPETPDGGVDEELGGGMVMDSKKRCANTDISAASTIEIKAKNPRPIVLLMVFMPDI